MTKETELERSRCVQIVDLTMIEASPEAQKALTRVRNMIANGLEPQTFREQVEQSLDELTPPPGQ